MMCPRPCPTVGKPIASYYVKCTGQDKHKRIMQAVRKPVRHGNNSFLQPILLELIGRSYNRSMQATSKRV
jgi:hypothetical protein